MAVLAVLPRLVDAASVVGSASCGADSVPVRQSQGPAKAGPGERSGDSARSSAVLARPFTPRPGDIASARPLAGPFGLQATQGVGPLPPAPSRAALADMPLQLTLTDPQIRAINAEYQAQSLNAVFGAFDDVIVVAPTWEAPMRDVTREVWGGLAAPVWAILHPAQAWRIFLPIPPR
jgi:hypothetical protein